MQPVKEDLEGSRLNRGPARWLIDNERLSNDLKIEHTYDELINYELRIQQTTIPLCSSFEKALLLIYYCFHFSVNVFGYQPFRTKKVT